MRKVAVVSALSAVLGYAAVYSAFFTGPKAAPAAPAPAAVGAPAALAAVVEVNDPAGLLDAPCPVCGDGHAFDLVVPAGHAAPADAPPAAPPIPPAAD